MLVKEKRKKRKKKVKAQTIINQVSEEMERKYNPEQLICELILRLNPNLRKQLNKGKENERRE